MKLTTWLKVAAGMIITETKEYFLAISTYAEVAEAHPEVSAFDSAALSVLQWEELEADLDAKDFANRHVTTTALTKEVDYSDMYAPKKIIN